MTGKIWIEAGEIAKMLTISRPTFLRSLDRLTEEDGFPLPSPHRLKPMTWRREAVEAWVNNLGYSKDDLQAVPPGPGAGGKVHVLRMAEAG